jgi:hypothetical protein
MAQYNANTSTFLGQSKTLFEVNMLATESGQPVTNTNPLPVTLGSNNITITGSVNIGTTVEVSSTPENPVHTHITEVGNSGLLTVSYMPIGGNVVVTSGNVAVTGIVNVGNIPASQNVVVTSGNLNANVSGNVVISSGNVAVTGSVNVGNIPASQNVVVTSGNFAFDPLASDAFGRHRVSLPLTLFDSSHRYKDNGLWSTSNTSGTTYAFSPNEGLVNLNLPTTANAEIIRETNKVFAYQPGKSLLVLNTFVPEPPKTNLRQRIGYFGAQNGIYYELEGNTAYFVERSYVSGSLVETRVAQADWSENTLSSFDKSKAQIFWMDIEWLGLGTVRCGFVINGKFIHCHSFHHANLITSTYITTASLPIRYEIKNTDTTASVSTMKQVCSSVISEGGYELRGIQQAIGIPITAARTLATAGTFYPIVSLRLKSTALDAIVILTAISTIADTASNFNWQVKANTTTTGGTWVSAGADSAVEYNITGTSTSGGRVLASGFFTATQSTSVSVDILKEALFKFQLERNSLTGTPFEISLVLAAKTNNEGVYASMDWEEVSR